VLTFEGHLIQFVSQGLSSDAKTDGKPGAGQSSIEAVTQDKGLNPHGKSLDSDQYRQLLGILDRYRQQEDVLSRQNVQQTREALLQAVTRQQYVSREQRRCVATDPHELAIEWKIQSERAREEEKNTISELKARLGQPMRDWAYSSCGTHEPDGIPRSTVVYFTRADAPEVFACRERIVALYKERRADLRSFFASLP